MAAVAAALMRRPIATAIETVVATALETAAQPPGRGGFGRLAGDSEDIGTVFLDETLASRAEQTVFRQQS